MAMGDQCAALAVSLGLSLPQWLSELFQTYSLCGAELFWQAYPPENDLTADYITRADAKPHSG